MFLHSSHLPQVLPSASYHAPAAFECERQRLFEPAWHCVTTLAELPKDGSYITCTLLDRPILVRRESGQVRAYLNVCAHRFACLTNQARGVMPTLRCQVHGWEYDAAGRTRKIPDARSFRPLEAGLASLTCLKAETVGQLVFVSLDAAAPPLAEFLGEGYAMAAELDGQWGLSWSYDQDLDADWKLSVENVLENYHNAAIHPRTFAITPPEEACRHRVFERGTVYDEPPNPDSPLAWQGRLLERWLGHPLDGYRHLHVFPHVSLGRMGPIRWVHCALPAAPGRAWVVWRFFHFRGAGGSWRARCSAPLLKRWVRSFFRTVLKEDETALVAMQRGLESPVHPPGGLISTREERIFYFQRYVLEQTQTERSAPATPTLESRAADAAASVARGSADSCVCPTLPLGADR